MDLQSAFYVVGIVFMGLMFVILVTLLVAVLVIRAKVNAIHRHVEDKLVTMLNLIEHSSKIVAKVKQASKRR